MEERFVFRLPPAGLTMGDCRTRNCGFDIEFRGVLRLFFRRLAGSPCGCDVADSPSISMSASTGDVVAELPLGCW